MASRIGEQPRQSACHFIQLQGKYLLTNAATKLNKLIVPMLAIFAASSIPKAEAGPVAYAICVEGCFALLPPLAPACVFGCLPVLYAPTP